MERIREIEECALNAWPPLQQLVLDGWLLRFADGFTRRANSVNPVYPGNRDAEAKIALCREIYRERGRRCVFKLTPLAQPPGLDELLARLGFAREAETAVQVLERLPERAQGAGELLLDADGGEWLETFSRMNEVAGYNRAALEAILAHIPGQTWRALVKLEGATVACGLAVRERETVGLFDLVTDAGARRQGHGARLVSGLLAHARAAGARRAYLQVVCDNHPALRLYEKLGFREIYRYWYRVQD